MKAVIKFNMTKQETETSQQLNWTELTSLYNRLDHEQWVEFRNKLAQLIKQPVLAQRIESHLANLSQEELERMLIYTRLLLMS